MREWGIAAAGFLLGYYTVKSQLLLSVARSDIQQTPAVAAYALLVQLFDGRVRAF